MNVDTALEFINQILMEKVRRRLRSPEITIIKGVWNGLTYAQMAEESSYSTNYLMRDIGPKFWRQLSNVLGEPTGKTNIRLVLDRLSQSSPDAFPSSKASNSNASHHVSEASHYSGEHTTLPPSFSPLHRVQVPSQDWQTQTFQAPQLRGRTTEAQTLLGWIHNFQCRLIGVRGLSGIGKTALLRTLVPQLQEQFEVVHWRSLQHSPQISDVLGTLHGSSSASPASPASSVGNVDEFLNWIQAKPRLLILDNVEHLLTIGTLAGQIRPAYELYDVLLQRISENDHNSCVIVVGMELPRTLSRLQDQTPHVQSLVLDGLAKSEATRLLTDEQLQDTESWPLLIDYYKGHPLALKLAAKLARDLFHGHSSELLAHQLCLLDEINTLFQQMLHRLSRLEQDILYVLATNAKVLSLAEIQANLPGSISTMQLVEALDSLKQRSLLLIEQTKSSSTFMLSDILKDSVRDYLIDQVGKNAATGHPSSTPLMSAKPSLRLTPVEQRPTCLGNWLKGSFAPSWQSMHDLLGNPHSVALRLRSIYQLRDATVIKRFKHIHFEAKMGIASSHPSVVCLVAIHGEADQSCKICIQAQPAPQQSCLPEGLTMRLLNGDGVSLAEVESSESDSFVQLPYFSGFPEECFNVELALGEQNHHEEFVI